jgi:prepilin-type N-terminal cleavage/methylation domain-containing protein
MRRRTGFTLIELLVAIALIVMILAVLASAFSVGLDSFGRLKAIGDMSERLRSAAHVIREDLAANHFEGDIRLSDPGFGSTVKPREGFFYIKQFGPSFNEGSSDSTTSWRSPNLDAAGKGQSHVLYMTVRRKGNQDKQFFSATLPSGAQLLPQAAHPDASSPFPNTPQTIGAVLGADARMQDPGKVMYRSQWAEVAYYLRPLPVNDKLLAIDTPLYALHRVTRVLASPENRRLTSLPRSQQDLYYGLSFWPPAPATGNINFSTPTDVTDPNRRSFNFAQTGTVVNEPTDAGAQHLPGWSDPDVSDTRFLVLPDVLSFTVQIIRVPNLNPVPPLTPPAFGFPVAGSYDFVDLTASGLPNVYDSTTGSGLLAIRITLRVWDVRSLQTRQISIIQDL